jgi:hypothetical protein
VRAARPGHDGAGARRLQQRQIPIERIDRDQDSRSGEAVSASRRTHHP